MAKLIKEISVFFPAYNLETKIEKTVKEAFIVIPKLAGKYEIMVVNDGSNDKTGNVLSSLKSKYKKLKVITHKVNRGYGGALKSGFYNSKYSWIAFTDADGQFDISELPKLIKKQKQTKADIIAGYYYKRAVPWWRKLNTWLWQLVVRMLFGLKVRDIDCGFKLINKKVVDTIPKLESERGAFISSEFLIKAQKYGFKIVETGVHHYPRTEGKGTGANLDVIIKSFVDLFKLWRKLR
jgi:glycosyltransferase involved in cell wall biosynthesis